MTSTILGRAAVCAALLGMATTLSCVPADSAAPAIGKRAPEYGGTTLQGDYVSLASLEGKVVLLNLWATWCAPCRHETPFLQSLYEERRGDGLEIVGISMDTGDAGDLVEEFVGEYGVTYTVLLDPQMRGMELYQVLGLPATFLIDREGTLTWMRFGPVGETDTDFLNALDAALE
jgi:peroxiredoxin